MNKTASTEITSPPPQNIESVLHETRIFHPPESFSKTATIGGMDTYHQLYRQSVSDERGFWGQMANQYICWKLPFKTVLDESNPPFYRWFVEGKLNVSWNCLDRHLEDGLGDKTALIFESDDGQVSHVSYLELHARVCRVANVLRRLGVTEGDRVIIYIPMSVEGVIAMQACARIGAIHSVVFGGFSAKSLHERIVDTGAKLIITADEQRRGGKALPIKAIVDEALSMGGCEKVTTTLVYRRTGAKVNMKGGRDVWWHEEEAREKPECTPAWVDSEHPLFILYTSGSTGRPKGIQHSSAGYLLWAQMTMHWTFDIKSSDIFWCTADIGWITGHSYVAYGPLAVGATQLVFEGVPAYPHPGRFWEMIARHRCTIFYTAPTAIRSLIKMSDASPEHAPQKYDLGSLRILGSVGEPINPAAWIWYHEQVGGGRCPVLDTFWQTETGGHVITPLPGATPLVPGSCTLPLPGIQATVVDEAGKELELGQGGLLVIKRPWPAMARTIWGDPERFKKTYFPPELGGRLYLAGDGAVRDKQTGYFMIVGRIDDVLNVSGHRLGTMEIESALVSHSKRVAEAAVVGRPDDLTGEAIVAFVVLKGERPQGEEAKKIALELREWVSKEIGPIAKPRYIRFGDNLPKTRSGKIMRRLLRSLARNEPITQDTSTLENPAILEQLQQDVV